MRKTLNTLIAILVYGIGHGQIFGTYVAEGLGDPITMNSSCITVYPNSSFSLVETIVRIEHYGGSTSRVKLNGEAVKRGKHFLFLGQEKELEQVLLTRSDSATKEGVKIRGLRGSELVPYDTLEMKQMLNGLDTFEVNFIQTNSTAVLLINNKCYKKYNPYESEQLEFSECDPVLQLSNVNEKVYVRESGDIRFVNGPKKSIIRFEKDSVYIIDVPHLKGGVLGFYIGTYELDFQKFNIRIEISKSMSISLNTGKVISYSTDCLDDVILKATEKRTLERDIRDSNRLRSEEETEQNNILKYIYEAENLASNISEYTWVMKFKDFENDEFLKKCK